MLILTNKMTKNSEQKVMGFWLLSIWEDESGGVELYLVFTV